VLTGGGPVPIATALGEGLFWIAALDDFFTRRYGARGYRLLRASDTRGRTAGGLIFARNLLGHGLHISGAIHLKAHAPTVVVEPGKLTLRWARLPGIDYGSPDRGTVFSAQMLWADAADLPKSRGPTHGRDRWYEQLVARRPLSQPMTTTEAWFRAVSDARRTELAISCLAPL
jgi:hypothetical protein